MPPRTALAFAALLALASPARAAADFDSLMSRARQSRQDDEFEAAARDYETALAARADPEAEMELGRVYVDLGRPASAVRIFLALLERTPNRYWPHVQLAQAYLQLGRLKEAKDEFAVARKIDPKASDAYVKEGYGRLAFGDGIGGERTLQALIAVDSASFAGYQHLGALLSMQGRHAEAEPYFREALRRLEADPGSDLTEISHSTLWLSDALDQQGRAPEAEDVLRAVLERAKAPSEGRAPLLIALADHYGSRSRTAEAEAAYAEAAASGEPLQISRAMVALASLLLAQNRRAEAGAAAERAFSASGRIAAGQMVPGFGGAAGLLKRLGELFERLGQDARAEETYRRVLQAEKRLPASAEMQGAMSALANLCLKTGRRAEAEGLLDRAARIAGRRGDRPGQAGLLERLADAYDEEGRHWKARWTRPRAR